MAASLLVLAPAAVAQAQTTFNYTGAAQTYTVPAGVTKIQVVADGASGGIYGDVSNTAVGAHVVANLTVVPGEVLTVSVGGQGATGSGGTQAGGFNGGGNGAHLVGAAHGYPGGGAGPGHAGHVVAEAVEGAHHHAG